jgi:DinB superfamily
MTDDLRYPTGKFSFDPAVTPGTRAKSIAAIREAPALMRAALQGLSDARLDTPYRDGGWTPRQIAHHVAESHMNAYIRFKLALTESNPTIKPYDEKLWAKTADVAREPAGTSIALLESLHMRWVTVLETMTPEDFTRTVFHPEHKRELSLDWMLQLYAWHGRHHAAHIALVKGHGAGG